MRDIKAPRAWYKPLGVMIQPEHVESINFDTKTIGVYLNMDGSGYHRLRLSDFELMWPTGLKDGTTDEEWYEGDIFAPDYSLRQAEVKIICYDTYQGRYKAVPLSLYLKNAGNGGWTGYDIKYWNQRLGNIHDNPELLQPQGANKLG